MPTQAIQQWFNESGYAHHCFLSFARDPGGLTLGYARRVQRALENELGLAWARPSVFLDERGLRTGQVWEPELGAALCRSICMVALCTPIYFQEQHPWCGREWAGMTELGEVRLAGSTQTLIIPLHVRTTTELPLGARPLQHRDCSRVFVQSNYFMSTRFGALIRDVTGIVEALAAELCARGVAADCDRYVLPPTSAFAGSTPPAPRFPF